MKIIMLNGLVEAEGEDRELACYTMLILECMKRLKETEDKENAENEVRIMQEMMKASFDDLLKREQDVEDK